MSVFEYFEKRFGSKDVRLCGMAAYVIKTIFATSVYIYGPGSALNAITNLNENVSIGIIGVIATFYTAIGGIKAVIWTDFYQTIIMICVLIIIISKGIFDIGGFDNLWQINMYGERLELFDFNPDPFIRQSFWSQTIGWIFVLSLFYSVDQQMIQRFIASKNKKTAQKALFYHMPLIFMFYSLVCLCGLVMYASFFTCDLILGNKISNQNQLLGYFVTNNLNSWPGMSGLFLGAVFCASFSSISSALSSLSSIIWQDFCMLIPFFKRLNDSKSVLTTKLLVFICGFIGTSFAFMLASIKGNLIMLSSGIQSALAAPILAIFILGAFFTCTNKLGVIIGTIVGFLVGLWQSLGSNIVKPTYPQLSKSVEFCDYNMSTYEIYEKYLKNEIIESNKVNATIFANGGRATNLSGFNVFYSMSYMYTFLFGLIITVLAGLIASFIVNLIKKQPEVDDSFIIYDLFGRFKKKNKIDNKEDEVQNMCIDENLNDLNETEMSNYVIKL